MTFRFLTNGVGMMTNSTGLFILPNVQIGYNTVRIVVVNAAGTANSATVALTLLDDADQDGLGDASELLYFGASSTNDSSNALLDLDGDRMSNWDEFLPGTNPTNELSLLNLVVSATNAAQLQFIAQTNISYTVLRRMDLNTAPWTSLTNLFPSTSVRTVQITNVTAPGPVERYYRVVTPLVP